MENRPEILRGPGDQKAVLYDNIAMRAFGPVIEQAGADGATQVAERLLLRLERAGLNASDLTDDGLTTALQGLYDELDKSGREDDEDDD